MPTEVPDSPLWRSSGASREDLVRTCLVRAGTSRIIVVNRSDAPSGVEDSNLALRLFGRESVADGLGGDHYQLNKLAIWNQATSGGLEFTFFNLAPGSRRVSQGAECGHAAVAVALVAGSDRSNDGSSQPIRIRNVDTGQVLEVAAPSGDRDRPGDCVARVIHEPPIVAGNHTELEAPTGSGGQLHWDVVPAGNIFALIPDRKACDDPRARREIQASTLEWARTSGLPNAREEFIRAISYDATWEQRDRCRVEAVCHNGVERHNSLPVSGSSALCNQLVLDRLESPEFAPPRDRDELEIEFDLTSVSGVEIVTVEARRRSGHWEIASTSCTTNVRLLFEGTAFLSR